MKNIKDELQHIILGDEQAGRTSQLKKVQTFLRRHAETSGAAQNQKRFQSEETADLIKLLSRARVAFALEAISTGSREKRGRNSPYTYRYRSKYRKLF